MKNLMKWMMSIAVAAISLTGCENNFEEPTTVSNKFELTVTTDNLSRTEYDATLKDIKWSTGDQAQVFVNGSAQALAATIDVTDSRIASFTYSSTLGEGAALIQGFAPANAGEAELGTNEALRFALTLPTTQRATTATFDKSADILVADNLLVNITAEDVAAGKKSVGNFNFHRVVAVSEFTYEVTNSTLAASDEKVESVSFEVISTNNDKFLAGKMYVQPNDEGAKYVDANLAEITDNKDYFYAEDANKVKVILADQPSLKDGFKAWLVTAPITLAADDKLVFTVTTTAGTTITKTIAAVGKELSFSTKQLNTLTVNLDNSVTTEKSIKILAIGNSFSADAMEYLHGILKDVGYDYVSLGNLYISGCTLETHASHFATDSASYAYYETTNGEWTKTNYYTPYRALENEDWDYISLQQGSSVSGVESSFDPHLANLISVVTTKCPDAELVWHMTWAYQGNSTHSAFPTYSSDQMTMYNAIISAVQNKVLPHNFAKIVPNGTAIQNMRTSFVGDTLTRDGYHLSYDKGRYIAALTFAKTITGCDLEKITYIPSSQSYTDGVMAAMKESVNNAIAKPYEVTQSTYTTDPDAGEEVDGFEKILADNGYDIEEYIALELDVKSFSYYNSSGNNSSASYLYTKDNTSGNTPKKYAATKIFSKAELPNGALLVLKSGFMYRPDAWTSLDKKNTSSTRPGNVTATLTVVDDAWWSSWNYRGFNLAKDGTPILSEEEMAAVCECFAIFVPKPAYESTPLTDALVSNGYNPANYTPLAINWTKFAYYYSTKNDKGYGASQLKDATYSSTTAPKFVATQLFEKSDIPVGSIIVVINGHKYRPEGWTALDTKNATSARPGEVSTTLVVVDDAWWGSWNYRGFNVGNGSALTDETADTACASFGIFVPKN